MLTTENNTWKYPRIKWQIYAWLIPQTSAVGLSVSLTSFANISHHHNYHRFLSPKLSPFTLHFCKFFAHHLLMHCVKMPANDRNILTRLAETSMREYRFINRWKFSTRFYHRTWEILACGAAVTATSADYPLKATDGERVVNNRIYCLGFLLKLSSKARVK